MDRRCIFYDVYTYDENAHVCGMCVTRRCEKVYFAKVVAAAGRRYELYLARVAVANEKGEREKRVETFRFHEMRVRGFVPEEKHFDRSSLREKVYFR